MIVNLRNISITEINDLLINQNTCQPFNIQYADFNVINYLYDANIENDDLNQIYFYPDSTLVYFYISLFIKKISKFISTDFQYNLLNFCNTNRKKIFLFGDEDFVLERVKTNIRSDFPDIEVVGTTSGYNFESANIIKKINLNNPDILFVGLGLGRQEKWILENYKYINSKIIISVGGWFQYLSGNKKRAPEILRRFHLEWLHKLVLEFPRVWKRYIIGVPLFIFRIITKKIEIEFLEE